MKFFEILFFVCVALVYVKADEHPLHAMAKECQAENGASDDEVTAMIKLQPAGSYEGKCLRLCVLRRLDSLDENDHFNTEKALKVAAFLAKGDKVKESVGIEISISCQDVQVPEDHCEAAEKYFDCIRQHAEGKDAPSLDD